MADNTPTTPTTTTGCRCTERCKCCDAPKRTRRVAHINRNGGGTNLFNGTEIPGKFPDMKGPQTPPSPE